MTIKEAAQKLQELIEAAKETNIDSDVPTGQAILTAIKSLEAWDKVKTKIQEAQSSIFCTEDENTGLEIALILIDNRISEVENESK